MLSNKPRVLTDGPIGRNLLWFALPILAGNIAQALNGSINAMWIGHYLGEVALTGAANANNILFFLLGSVFGFSMATNIMIAQSVGAHDMDRVRRVVGTSATFFICLSTIISALGWWLTEPLLMAMDTPTESIALGATYLKVTFLATPLMFLFSFLAAAMRGTGDSSTPFKFMLLSVVLDIAFNPLFIFGLGPFPKMGIAGSAWGSFTAQVISLTALIFYLYRSQHILWLGKRYLSFYRIHWPILRILIVKGIPMGLQMVLVSLAMIAMMTLVNRYGATTAAAYSAAIQLWAYVQMPAMAIGAACSSFAAQNVGAKRWDRVSQTASYGVLFNFLLTGSISLLIVFFDRWTLAMFLPSGSESWEIAQHLNHIAIWSFMFFGVNFVISAIVRSTGAVIPPLLILVLSLWGIRVPFAYLLLPSMGTDAIWWSFPASAACSMFMSAAYYRWGNWRQAKILPPQ
ncbi:MAG: MATE family efflux transporter [Saezia sp.]